MRNSQYGRLLVWDQGGDKYTHSQLAANFDRLDALIGGPDGSPGSTGTNATGTMSSWLDTGVGGNDPYDRTLYSLFKGLQANDVPLGTVTMWWRPNASVPIPTGWVPCDGSTYVNNPSAIPAIRLHSYNQVSITTPDLRNSFVLGAAETNGINYTTAQPPTQLGRDGLAPTTPRTDNPKDGPGIGYASRTADSGTGIGAAKVNTVGSNVVRNLNHHHDPGSLTANDHTHVFPHTHTLSGHVHVMNHTHDVGPHVHDISHAHGMDHTHIYDHLHVVGDLNPETNPAGGGVIPGHIAQGDRVWSSRFLSSGDALLSGFGYRILGFGTPYAQTSQGLVPGGTGSGAVVRTATDGSNAQYSSQRADIGSTAATLNASPAATSSPSTDSTGMPQGTMQGSGPVPLSGETGNPIVLAGAQDINHVDITPTYVGLLFIMKILVVDHIT